MKRDLQPEERQKEDGEGWRAGGQQWGVKCVGYVDG